MSSAPQLSENVASRNTAGRCGNGVSIDLHPFHCTGRLLLQIEQEDEASSRLVARREEGGKDGAVAGTACATISLDAGALRERLGLAQPLELLDAQPLRFKDDRLSTLIRLLADAIDDPDPAAQLYGDALTAAIAARLLQGPKEMKRGVPGLSAMQLKDAISYLEARMPAKVDLATLARLAGLSQSHYNRAFKASTGLAPYQWQLRARVERAKDLLLNTNRCLEEVAEATGFADAVHFGRTFRKITGTTPAAWRADRLA